MICGCSDSQCQRQCDRFGGVGEGGGGAHVNDHYRSAKKNYAAGTISFFSHCRLHLIISDFCPLPDPDVGVSILVCDIEHTSFHFWCVRPQVCLVSVKCSRRYRSWKMH